MYTLYKYLMKMTSHAGTFYCCYKLTNTHKKLPLEGHESGANPKE